MAQNDIHRLTLVSTMAAGAVSMFNTFWFREEVAGLPPDQRATLANDFIGTVVNPDLNSLREFTSQEVTFAEVRVQRYYPWDGNVFAMPVGGSNIGRRVGNALPPLCANCITILSQRGGRRGRGRWYLPPVSSNDQNAGLYPAGIIALFNGMMGTINNRYGVAGGYLVSGFRIGVWSKLIAGSPPLTNGAGWSPMSGWLARPEVRGINRRSRVNPG